MCGVQLWQFDWCLWDVVWDSTVTLNCNWWVHSASKFILFLYVFDCSQNASGRKGEKENIKMEQLNTDETLLFSVWHCSVFMAASPALSIQRRSALNGEGKRWRNTEVFNTIDAIIINSAFVLCVWVDMRNVSDSASNEYVQCNKGKDEYGK